MANPMTPAVWRPCARPLAITCAFALGLVSVGIGPARGQPPVSRQEDIKATFLYNFAKFVDWPESSFDRTVDAFRIEIVGRDPFDGRLDQLMIGKHMHDRPIEVIHSLSHTYQTVVHVAFVSASEMNRVDSLLLEYRRNHVLTVSDIADFAQRGGMIGFISDAGAVRFRINQAAVEQAQLRMSARLLALGVPR
jgi:hypothetical protein